MKINYKISALLTTITVLIVISVVAPHSTHQPSKEQLKIGSQQTHSTMLDTPTTSSTVTTLLPTTVPLRASKAISERRTTTSMPAEPAHLDKLIPAAGDQSFTYCDPESDDCDEDRDYVTPEDDSLDQVGQDETEGE